jgi:hypothetical protein
MLYSCYQIIKPKLNNLIFLFYLCTKQCGLNSIILCVYNCLCYLRLGFQNFGLWKQQTLMIFCTF